MQEDPMRRMMTSTLALAALGAASLAAQYPATRPPADTGKKQPAIRAAAESVSQRSSLSSLLTQSRQAGLPDAKVQGLYDQLRRNGVADADAQRAVSGEVALVRAGGTKQNFGTTVNQQIARGLRGRDLSTAIRHEQDRQRKKATP
jgi:hypothetical protein